MAHEYEDPKNWLILAIGLGSIVTLTGAMFGLSSYYRILRDDEQYAKILGVESPQLLAQREKEKAALENYAYLDKAKGRVRIPVSQAMKTLAQRGRDGIPSLQPDPKSAYINPPADSTPAPAGSGSAAAPSGSAPPAGSAAPQDDKGGHGDKEKDKKDKDKKDKH